MMTMAKMTSPVIDIEEKTRNFSEGHGAKRAVALCTTYIKKLKDRETKQATQEMQVTAEELKKASMVMANTSLSRRED